MYILSYNKSQYIYTVYIIYTESESFKEYQVDCKSYLPKVIPGPQHIQKTSLGGPTATKAICALDHPMSINTVKKGTWRRVRSHGRKMIDSVCWKSLTKPIWGVSVRSGEMVLYSDEFPATTQLWHSVCLKPWSIKGECDGIRTGPPLSVDLANIPHVRFAPIPRV